MPSQSSETTSAERRGLGPGPCPPPGGSAGSDRPRPWLLPTPSAPSPGREDRRQRTASEGDSHCWSPRLAEPGAMPGGLCSSQCPLRAPAHQQPWARLGPGPPSHRGPKEPRFPAQPVPSGPLGTLCHHTLGAQPRDHCSLEPRLIFLGDPPRPASPFPAAREGLGSRVARCGLRSGKEPGRQQGSAGSGARSDPDGPRRGGTPGGARKWEIIFTVPFAPEGAHDQNGEDCQGLPETHLVCVREQIRLLSSDPPK